MDRKTWHQRLEEIEASIARLADFDAEIRRSVVSEDRDELDRAYHRWASERRELLRLIRAAFESLEVAVDLQVARPDCPLPPQPDLPPAPGLLIADAERSVAGSLVATQWMSGVAIMVLVLSVLVLMSRLAATGPTSGR
jgi:hypothetical protein